MLPKRKAPTAYQEAVDKLEEVEYFVKYPGKFSVTLDSEGRAIITLNSKEVSEYAFENHTAFVSDIAEVFRAVAKNYAKELREAARKEVEDTTREK